MVAEESVAMESPVVVKEVERLGVVTAAASRSQEDASCKVADDSIHHSSMLKLCRSCGSRRGFRTPAHARHP